jgi:mRNA interferase RelE/StbE
LYTVEYLSSVLIDDIPLLPKMAKIQIKRAIEERLTKGPVEFGKPLQFSLKGCRRLRVGDYRIIYKIEEASKIVLILKIGNRKEVYA